VASALKRWCQAYASLQNAKHFAVQYHSAQLHARFVLSWRKELREKSKLMKMARIASQFFITRRAWEAWDKALKVKARERHAKDIERQRLKKVFQRES
jgi:protein SFI1